MLTVDCSKEESARQLATSFNEACVIGILEPSGYVAVNILAPFMGAIVDWLRGLDCSSVTTTFLSVLTFLTFYIGVE